MAKTIPQLTDATTVNAADELIIQQGGITKRATANELLNGGATLTSTGSTTGRALKDRFSDVVNVKDFGAVGDGVADDSAAIQSAINYALSVTSASKVVYVPSGRYIIGTRLIANVPNLAFENAFSIVGDGQAETQLIASPSNSVGVLEIIGNGNQEVLSVKHLRITSSLQSDATTNGTALLLRSSLTPTTPGWGQKGNFSVQVDNVYIGSEGTNSSQMSARARWDIGIDCQYLWYPFISNVWIRTVNTATSPSANNTAGIRFTDCYDYRVIGAYIAGRFDNGILAWTDKTTGATFEGGVIDRCTIVGPFTGVYVNHAYAPLRTSGPALYEVGLHVLNCHINPRNYGVWLNYQRQAVISGTYFYVPSTSQTVNLPASIYLERASDVTVVNNQFNEAGYYVSDSNASCGIVLGAGSLGCVICGNVFNHGGISVYNASTQMGSNVVTGNVFHSGQRAWGTTLKSIVDTTSSLFVADAVNEDDTSRLYTISIGGNGAAARGVEIARPRTDFATVSSPDLSSILFNAPSSTGDIRNTASVQTRWRSNTDSSEYGAMLTTVRRGGSMITALDLNGGTSTSPAEASFGTLQLKANGGLTMSAGTGSPEGNVTADTGSLYFNKSGGASTTLYVKTSGSGNTGWTAK